MDTRRAGFRPLPLAVGLVVLVTAGVVHGIWTNRWTTSAELEAAPAKLASVPLTVEDWEGEERTLPAAHVRVAEIAGYLMRDYTNRTDGSRVSLLVVAGRPKSVAVHTPDVCYGGLGYVLTEPAAVKKVDVADGTPTDFFLGRFRKDEAGVSTYLRIHWAWTTDGHWEAPSNPRVAYLAKPALYKLYVIQPLAKPDEPLEKSPSRRFLAAFLPVFNRHVFAKP
jgi:hypothetical protein